MVITRLKYMFSCFYLTSLSQRLNINVNEIVGMCTHWFIPFEVLYVKCFPTDTCKYMQSVFNFLLIAPILFCIIGESFPYSRVDTTWEGGLCWRIQHIPKQIAQIAGRQQIYGIQILKKNNAMVSNFYMQTNESSQFQGKCVRCRWTKQHNFLQIMISIYEN